MEAGGVPERGAGDKSLAAAELESHARAAEPLAGKVVVLDPGHQLGNARHPRETNAQVDAGGFTKACNTTGTATDDGYPEATLTWEVASLVRARLEKRGAQVVLTRSHNSVEEWGPCVDVRGRAGNPGAPGPTADLKISLHADGNLGADASGFHVIVPAGEDPLARASWRLGREVRGALVAADVPISSYTAVHGIHARDDLGTLNLARIPSVMVELGNMRDETDATRMTSEQGRRTYARAVAAAVERYLGAD
ncbi:N-acetylmuramoyl-L-alanine amidase [Nocardioides sp. BGMRC 2183]|nr:N-acetylmuramoyl-L-alanine amidase [Nocardioides sp. BGMRC 2183]